MFYNAVYDQTLVRLALYAPDDASAVTAARRYYPKRALVKLIRVKDGREVDLGRFPVINAKVRTRV